MNTTVSENDIIPRTYSPYTPECLCAKHLRFTYVNATLRISICLSIKQVDNAHWTSYKNDLRLHKIYTERRNKFLHSAINILTDHL